MEYGELTELIAKAQSGDHDATEELLRVAHTPVSYQCRKLLKDPRDAEDMTQEVLFKVYDRLNLLKNPEAFWGWLNSITVNQCMNTLKRNHVELQFEEDEYSVLDNLEELDEQQVPDKALDNTETARMIEEIVNSLPEAQRICTLMYYYDEMNVKEIAEVVGVPENTVKSRLNYARKAIKEQVLDYEKKGVKLYGLSPLPFLLYFLGRAAKEGADSAQATAAAKQVMELGAASAAVGGAAATGSAAVSGASSAAGAAAGEIAAAAGASAAGGTAATAGTAASHFLGGLSIKAVAGFLAAILTVGGITGAVVLANRTEPGPAASPTVPIEEETATPGPTGEPIETDANEGDLIPEDPGPPDSPYDTVTEYDPSTYIARTTLVTDLDNIEIYFEFPVFPETTEGIWEINSIFREIRNVFFRDENGNIAWALEAARNPIVDDLFYDNCRCSIETFNDEITSVRLLGNWYIGGQITSEFSSLNFHNDTGMLLEVLDVLPCSRTEYEQYLTQAVTNEGLIRVADLSGDTTQFPFYVSDGAVYVGVPMTMGRDGYSYVRLDIPSQSGASTPSESPSGSPSALLGSIAYHGDPARCVMSAEQARAFADVIRSQWAELEQTYEQNKSYYDEWSHGMTLHDYAALVDTGNGIPILVCAGGMSVATDDRSVYWENLSSFTIWQYVDGQAVQFQPADANGVGVTITSSGVWFGWDGSTEPHYEVRKVNARRYPFQKEQISAQAADTLYGSYESFQINGAVATQQEFETQLANFASDIYVISAVGSDPSGGFTGVCPAEQVLEALTVWGGF